MPTGKQPDFQNHNIIIISQLYMHCKYKIQKKQKVWILFTKRTFTFFMNCQLKKVFKCATL